MGRFPPPIPQGRERKPNWTIATRSGQGSRTWSPFLRLWEMGSLGSLFHGLPQGGTARAGGASGRSCLRALSPGVMRRDRLLDWVPVFPGGMAFRGVRPPPLRGSLGFPGNCEGIRMCPGAASDTAMALARPAIISQGYLLRVEDSLVPTCD